MGHRRHVDNTFMSGDLYKESERGINRVNRRRMNRKKVTQGPLKWLRNAFFSGNWTPTHPLVTLITLNLTPL